jgi:very-short-patch-repair endonuclease
VVARRQLLELGLSADWIRHRLAKGRLHPIHPGVYAVGRPEVTRLGRWMAAVLACGVNAVLSHESAAALWGIRSERGRSRPIDVSLHADSGRRRPGISIHRRPSLQPHDLTTHRGIPVTTPVRTLIDLATALTQNHLEAAINEADVLDLIDPETLRAALEDHPGQPGVRRLKTLLDRHTFRLTDSELERHFLRIVRAAGLPLPDTQVKGEGHRIDFYWPELGLVVETDGLRYHRTPSRQARDNRRMQAHAAAGRIAVRVSHYEIRYESGRVIALLAELIQARYGSIRPRRIA